MMARLEALLDSVLSGGVLLTPLWLTYKLVMYVLS